MTIADHPRDTTEDLTEDRFNSYATRWRLEAQTADTLLELVTIPSYQHIIGMGRTVVKYILRELAKQPDHWFWALKAITAEDPVPVEDRGNITKMTEAWLQWGARNGYDL